MTEEPSPAPVSDEDLLLQVGRGEEAALVELIERWKRPLLNFFFRSLHCHARAEDLAQLVFIRLYRAASRYRPEARFSTYLFQIARRLLINELRREQRKPLDYVEPEQLRAIDSGLSDRRLREIEEVFAQTLTELPENQRTALLLFKQQELSYQEIAHLMESSESAVKTWIFRARQHLRQRLQELL